jgi:hypothetical protein
MAKLDAFDALSNAGHTAAVPLSVYLEAARPELAFRHPEIGTVQRLREEGGLEVVTLEPSEAEVASELADRYGGLHAGELDVLALGHARGWNVCLHERQASRLATSLGLGTIHVVELLFAGTPDPDLLERRGRNFARLTNLTMNDLDSLLNLIRERR